MLPSAAIPSVLPTRPVLPARAGGRGAQNVENRTTGHETQASALDMSDDVSALMAALRARRTQDGGTGQAQADAWFERILTEDAFECAAQFHAALDEGATSEALAGLAHSLFPDGSDRFAMLTALLSTCDVGSARRKRIQALLDAMADAPPEGEPSFAALRGGANVALTARAFGAKMRAEPRALRSSYRQFLASDMAELDTYEAWMDRFGFDRRADVLDFIDQALVADMLALDPSGGRVEFGLLLEHLSVLRALRSFDKQALSSRAQRVMRQATATPDEAWLRALISLLRTGVAGAGPFREIVSRAAFLLNAADNAAFLQSMTSTLRDVPHRLWPADDDPAGIIAMLATWVGSAGARESRSTGVARGSYA